MGVFEGDRPTEANEALAWAAGRLLSRMRELGLPGSDGERWSIAELRLSEDDYEWLYTTFASAEWSRFAELTRHANGRPSPQRPTVVQGLVLLAVVSECARRIATEQELWPCVEAQPLWRGKAELLDHGRERLLDRIYAATAALGIRECDPGADRQQHRDTIFLQFGFTRHGCVERLGDWLTGGTYAIRELLGLERGDDIRNASPSFRHLLRALRLYKQRKWTMEQMQAVLDDSPWVLPSWRDHLVAELDRSGELAYDADLDELPRRLLLGEPRLRWTGREPQLELAIRADRRWPTEYQAARYWVWLAGVRRLELRRSGDGYQPRPRQALLPLPCDDLPTTLKAWVGDDSGHTVESIGPWTLYDADREVNLWSARGQRTESDDPLARTLSYTMLLAPGHTVKPQPEEWSRTAAGCFYRLPENWPEETQVLDAAGQLVWQPATGERRRWPEWMDGVRAEVTGPVTFGDVPQVRVQVQAGTGIEWVQVDREPKVVPVNRPVTAEVSGSEIRAEPGGGSVVVNVGVWREGSERCRNLRVLLPLDADVLVRSGGEGKPDAWEVLRPDGAIRRTGHPPKLVCFRPQNAGGHELWAGGKFLGWMDLDAGRSTLSMPEWSPGLGEELALWRDGQKARALGTIVSAQPFENGMLDGDVLTLPRAEPPGPDHRVVWWGNDGGVAVLEPVGAGGAWLVEAPDPTTPRAVAVVWRGQLDSTWHDEHWCDGLGELGPEAAVVAGWLRLPLLGEPALSIFRAIAQDQGPQVLRSWLSARCLPADMAPPAEEVGEAMRAALGLDPAALGWGLRDLVSLLDGLSPAPVLRRLLGWDAAWTAGLLREWVVGHALATQGLTATGEVLDDLVRASGENVPDELRLLAEELAGVRQERERWLKSMQSP